MLQQRGETEALIQRRCHHVLLDSVCADQGYLFAEGRCANEALFAKKSTSLLMVYIIRKTLCTL